MPEHSHGPSGFDQRLADIDRRLREIQSELLPDRAVPAPVIRAPIAAGNPGELQTKLLSAVRELLDAIELVASRPVTAAVEDAPVARWAGSVEAASAAPVSSVELSAGPFASTEAVREFQRAVGAIPGVSEVEVRVYEGESRAVFDVQLA